MDILRGGFTTFHIHVQTDHGELSEELFLNKEKPKTWISYSRYIGLHYTGRTNDFGNNDSGFSLELFEPLANTQAVVMRLIDLPYTIRVGDTGKGLLFRSQFPPANREVVWVCGNNMPRD
jgi:hypothetical protein